MSDLPPEPVRRPTRRRRVFHTAGLTASAAVLALSIQAGSLNGDDDGPAASYGDSTILDPDDPGSSSASAGEQAPG